jgi:hypothetical protein
MDSEIKHIILEFTIVVFGFIYRKFELGKYRNKNRSRGTGDGL